MDRYSIISKKSEIIEKPEKVKPLKKEIEVKSWQGKKIHEEWAIEDRNYRVSFEISPRNSSCSQGECKIEKFRSLCPQPRLIPKGVARYRVIYKWRNYNETRFYHRNCLPLKIEKFIKNYEKRDIAKEEMKIAYNKIIGTLNSFREVIGEKYFKKLLSDIADYSLEALKRKHE